MTRRLTVEIVGGTAEQQASYLRSIAFSIESGATWLYSGKINHSITVEGLSYTAVIEEMATYDRKLLADAWYDSDIGSLNKLARRADIETERLRNIMLGEGKPATAKELNAICEELGISLESVRGDAQWRTAACRGNVI